MKEELININGIREDLYQAMQIGDITLNSKVSQELYDFMNYQDKEIERLKTDKEQLNSLVNSCQKEIRRLKEELKQAKEIALNDHKYASEMEDKYIEANNIINELEKTLLEWHEYWEYDDSYSWQYKNAYDYIQELKGSVSNE